MEISLERASLTTWGNEPALPVISQQITDNRRRRFESPPQSPHVANEFYSNDIPWLNIAS